ncbi:TIGR04076 family protein [Methanobacterium sp. CWC-01]|jgi:uncharacterized repeat protein (TIGR04076 family)|uniref:TIGR04076 family protein n=1 Tax=Methanobacterium aridiramus TaxID=2584467 RepID=UPI002575F1A8|nr:TIGR04076 family protein [Methanobacterium sp. CWC-01]WJI10268.1 TIGR04076 family protein [Methanobacterium sp. CWC-01]
MLEITVEAIKGRCPVYRKGDRMVFDGPEIVLEDTDALCTHALSTILHYTTILDEHWIPLELGLTREGDEEHAYLQCADPGQPYTEGGTVIFCCRQVKGGD